MSDAIAPLLLTAMAIPIGLYTYGEDIGYMFTQMKRDRRILPRGYTIKADNSLNILRLMFDGRQVATSSMYYSDREMKRYWRKLRKHAMMRRDLGLDRASDKPRPSILDTPSVALSFAVERDRWQRRVRELEKEIEELKNTTPVYGTPTKSKPLNDGIHDVVEGVSDDLAEAQTRHNQLLMRARTRASKFNAGGYLPF